jgi:hypothetical protein
MKGVGGSFLLFGIGAVAVQLQKNIVHLQKICVVLGIGYSLNQEKVGRGAFLMFGIGGVYGTILYTV